MKKDLILIGAYCPDSEREIILNNCVDSLQKLRKDFDLLVCAHTHVPKYISEKVDYVFFDKENDLIFDWEYINQPWFSPLDGVMINSTFISNFSTYFSCYRIFISGLGIAKIYGYEKIHYLEYDSLINDYSDFYENSTLLNEYDCVLIKKQSKDYEENLDSAQGFFISARMDRIDGRFQTFDKESLINLMYEFGSKTNEKITLGILTKNKKVFIKNYYDVVEKNNFYNLSRNIQAQSTDGWYVPFYNTKANILQVVVWNKKEEPVNVCFVINNSEIISFNEIKKFEWSIKDVGFIENVNSILVIVNDKIKNKIIFDNKTREIFKKTNFSTHI